MIEGDVGDDAETRFNYVGRIQTAAHADLKHYHVRPGSGEMLKGHRGERFKEAGMPRQIAFSNQALGGAVDYVVEEREIVVADGFAIEANALIDAKQMWRSIEPGLQSGSLKDGCQRRRCRALAVSADDEHSWKTVFRMPQCGQQHAHVRQIELVRRRLGQFVA
jgi:hypothetical protein